MTVTPKPEAPTRGTLLGTSAAIFLIRFFPTLASVVALVWLARCITPAYYGRYQGFWVQWQVLHVVACLGLPTLLLTYPGARLRGLVQAARLAHLAGLAGWVGVVASGFGVMQWWAGSAFAPWQAGLFLLLSVPIAILEAYALGRRQLRAVALVSAGYAGLFVLSHALLVAQAISSEQLMSGLLLASALRLAALGYLARLGPSVVSLAEPLAWPAVRSHWAHTAFNDVVQVLFRWVDKLALNFLLPAALFALYFNGTLDVPFLPLLLGAAGSTLLLHFGEPGLTDAGRLATLRAAATLLGQLVFPLFFFLLFFRRELLGVVFAHRYDAAVPLFVVSSLVVPLRAYNFTALLQHKGQGHRISRGAVLDLALALALMYPLYRLLGLVGAALAFVLSTYAQAGYYLAHTARLLRVPWASLVPWRPWAAQLLGAALGLGLLHTLLAHWLAERAALLVGAGALALWLAGQLWLARRMPD
jgi:O-antigen/teichoic acid export membrane protein